MYNEKQKDRYLQYKNDEYSRLLESVFSRSDDLECLYGKDICNFGYEEVQDLMHFLNLGTYQAVCFFFYSYSNYVDWCLSEGLVKDNINHFRDIGFDVLPSFINKKLLEERTWDRQKVLNFTTQLENARDRLFLLSCFEFGVGRGYEDFLNIEMGDVDEEKLVLQLKTRNVKVTKEWVKIAHEADTEDYIFSNIHNYDAPHRKKIDLVPSKKLFKTTSRGKNVSDDPMFIQKRMGRIWDSIRKTLGMNEAVKAKNIINSGRIYFANTNAKELNISGYDYVKTHRKEMESQFGILCNPVIFNREFGDYLI